ncbi:1-aminocyclopropane-1-carboxylate synthase-like protein 1 [Stigmatopora argus]
MDPRGRRHERGSNWTDQEIVELLQLWSDESVQIELESSLRNQRVFDRIALILRDKGIFRTGDQCREKIKKMKLEYRRTKENHKLRPWKFYDVMDRVLANRPSSITYSTLGGTVVAKQVFQSPGGSEVFLQGNYSLGSFGPASSGGFLFGQPPQTGDPLDVKSEDVEESLFNVDVTRLDMYSRSGDEQETNGQVLLGAEDTLEQGDSSAHSRTSPSGLNDDNISASSSKSSSVPMPHDTSKEGFRPPAAAKQRRRRKGKTACGHGSEKCGGTGPLDKALTNFLKWQQCAEDRLICLEEARLEKELQADERRKQQEERRVEQERQHELRLFSMLTGALTAVRQGAATTETAPSNTLVSLLDHQSAFMTTSTASSAPSTCQPLPQAPSEQTLLAKRTIKSEMQPSVKDCTTTDSALESVRGAKSPEPSRYLSKRGNSIREHKAILQEGYIQYGANKYGVENTNGIINMGTSENKLCYDLLYERLTRSDMLHIDPSFLQYGDWRGHAFLREEVAKFLTHYCCSPKPLKADNVVVMNGCSALFSSIAAVICDPKDAILIPSPFYGVITEDLLLYSDVKLFHVPLDCQDDNNDGRLFHLTVSKLEEGLQKAKTEGVNIKAIILMNPHNPLAEIYTPKEMLSFLEFAQRNELHAIVDEVYMLTVFDESVTFHSVLSLESLPDPQRTHIMWGLSKDFAMAGIRLGTLYTENQYLVKALSQLGSFHGISGTTQHQVANLLQDREWISKAFLPVNRRRLKIAHRYLTEELQTMDIDYLDRPATLYVWADFRKFLSTPSFEEELFMWRCFLKHKVLLSCGQAFSCSTPGWFRIVFADQQHHLQVGLKRIREALKEIKESRASRDSFIVKEATEEIRRPEEDNSEISDNATIEKSTPSPQSKSSDQLKENASSVLVTGSQAPDEFLLLDCQASKPAESLGSLIGTLKDQIRSSDWLEKNTPKRSAGEDPEILDVFKALLERARK